jgi:hypothetical protein
MSCTSFSGEDAGRPPCALCPSLPRHQQLSSASPWLPHTPFALLRLWCGALHAQQGVEAGIGLGRAATTLSLRSVVAGAREHGPGCVRRPHRGHTSCGIVRRIPWSTAWAVVLLHDVWRCHAWSHAPICRVLRLRDHTGISSSEGMLRPACPAWFFSLGCHTALRPQEMVSGRSYVVRACRRTRLPEASGSALLVPETSGGGGRRP